MSPRIVLTVTALLAVTAPSRAAQPELGIQLQKLASVATGAGGAAGAEIVAFDATSRRAFAINSSDNDLAVIDLSDPAAPSLVAKVSLNAYGAGLNGVDTHAGLVAVAVEASPKTAPGKVVFLDAETLQVEGAVTVGALPDMLTFADDGRRVLVANEGEPNSYGQPDSVNPEGSISIIDLEAGVGAAVVDTADFKAFDGQRDALIAAGVRIYGPGATVAEDLEPEYIAHRGRTAWVTLQEANAVAVVDIPTATVEKIIPLGLKDHMVEGSGLDPSDRDGPGKTAAIAIDNWPVYGMYQPDAIASFKVGAETFLVTANEGDARSSDDFPGFGEEVRLKSDAYKLDPAAFPDPAALKDDAALGRLNVSSATGDLDGDGDFDRIEVFGARSFSIWSATGQLVWDSGDAIERYFADAANGQRHVFNANNTPGSLLDDRSDNKGPEPEGVAVGRVGPRVYAFIGLERVGGVMAYDITDPHAPTFAAYANTRASQDGGDLGPEGVTFVSGEESPNGEPLVLLGNETSGTVTVFRVHAAQE